MKAASETTLGAWIAKSLLAAAKGNAQTSAAATAVLWPDKEQVWQATLPALMNLLPGLLTLGPFVTEQRSGPAIWLKCVIAGAVPEVLPEAVPIVYLPGVSRSDLRAIEHCPRDLQPLAELQYRGTFWSQANGKDWTVNAFLTSKNGGLGLNVAQDQATQEALLQALAAGVLLDRPLAELQTRSINAEWLHSLLAPNPTRDLLVWLNEPEAAQKRWTGPRWDVFCKRCKADFGFNPVGDGTLAAAERLAKGDGKWSAVAELYRDSYASFPFIYALLLKVQPPRQDDLFQEPTELAGYPQINDRKECELRYAMSACVAMTAGQARSAILAADKAEAPRRGWLWARMGLSPLATALGHLAELANRSAQLPAGSEPDELARNYQQDGGWLVDRAALRALGAVQTKADVDAVSAALRAVYLPWIDEGATRLQQAAAAAGGLPGSPKESSTSPPDMPADGLCTVFVDGLRYDVAMELKERLASLGKVAVDARWTSMPSVTASGKAWCAPVAHLVGGDKNDLTFEPRVAADGKPLSGHNFRKLLFDNGIQPLDAHATGDPAGKAWTEAGDLDYYGHAHGLRLARDLDSQLAQVVERVTELRDAGWNRFRIVTDHGWLLMPGGLPKSELPKHQVETKWGRCAVLKDNVHGTPLTFGWSWCNEVQVAYAPGASCFIAGNDYAHGGLSLQECLVPVLSLDIEGGSAASVKADIRSVTWKRLRCLVEVDSDTDHLSVDIRTKAALASTSLAASVKLLEGGKANLAVADDDQMGTAALIVVLGPDGEVIQKAPTTVGG